MLESKFCNKASQSYVHSILTLFHWTILKELNVFHGIHGLELPITADNYEMSFPRI